MRFARLLIAAACAAPLFCHAQAAAGAVPPACASFLGFWSGTWSQGFYGKQLIHVTQVTDQCVATLAYSPTEAPPTVTHQVPITAGVMAFDCNVRGGTCRLEVVDEVLKFTYTDPSGFVNIGVFRKADR